MTRDEWRRVKSLSAAALDRPEVERQAYVAVACDGDLELEREVRSILAFSLKASRLFETPAFSPALPATPRFAVGSLINGRYLVEGIAGEGGMGAVYRVTDTVRSQTLALKTIRAEARFINLFKIEFKTLVELRHPNLARSYDFEPVAGSIESCFTMDYVDGCNAFDATAGAPWRDVLALLVQICRALAYVHSRGVIHRDIKPNNVLVQADATVKLVDFGLAGGAGDQGELIGTPAYLAPELVAGRAADHRADLFSLGILAYQLLCRRLPFTARGLTELMAQQSDLSLHWPEQIDVPGWLKTIVARLCAREPSDRFRGANQVIVAFNTMGGLEFPIETAATRDSYVLSGRFVGRRRELAALSDFTADRLGPEPSASDSLALVVGPAGVGKSRLISELRHELQLNRHAFIEGNCFEGAAAEYGAIAELLAPLVSLVESRGGFHLVARSASELMKVAPALGRTLTTVSSPALTTPDAERRRLLDTVAAFLVDAAALFPFVLYINDLQWAPHGTVEILRYLRRRIAISEREGRQVRIALIGSCREDEVTGRPIEGLLNEARGQCVLIRVEPLAPEPMARLLGSMFGLDDIPRTFVSRVLDEAAGSPFFLEEVVRALVENGSVFVEEGTWRTTTAIGDLEIPATVSSVLRRRLAMIESAEQLEVLRLLAAYKKPMPVSLVTAIMKTSPETIEQTLYALSARQMVTAADGQERAYRTAHDHLRTTIYADLGPMAATLHTRIAKGLEEVAGNGDGPLSELAHHYWLTPDKDAALKYALRAGSAALSIYANDEAVEHLEHALALLPADRRDVQARVLEELADASFLAGHYARAKSLLADLDRRVERPIDRTRVQRKLGEVIGYSEGTPHEAADIMWRAAETLGATRPRSKTAALVRTVTALGAHFVHQAALPLVPTANDESERARLTELAGLYLRIGYFTFFCEPLLFLLPVLRAANVIDRVGGGKEHSHVYSMAGVALGGLGLSARALRYGHEAILEARRSGSPWHLANAQSFHAIVLLQTGRWQEAIEHAERARAAFTACGDHFQLAVSVYQVLEVLHVRGDLHAAIARGREEVAAYERMGLQMIGKGFFTVFGQILTKTGDEAGVAILADVLARATQGSDQLSAAFAHLALGDSLLQLGRVDEAIDHLERGLAIRDWHRFDVYLVAQGSALLAQAYAARIRAGGAAYAGNARRAFDRCVKQAAAAGRRFPPMRISARLTRGIQHRFRRQDARAVACFDEAARLAAAQGARLWQADAHFESGLTLASDGGRRRVAAQAQFENALTLYKNCGAAPGERRAAAALAGLS